MKVFFSCKESCCVGVRFLGWRHQDNSREWLFPHLSLTHSIGFLSTLFISSSVADRLDELRRRVVTYKGPGLKCWGNPGSNLTLFNPFAERTPTHVLGQTKFPFNILEPFRRSFFFRLYVGSVFISLISLQSLLFLSHIILRAMLQISNPARRMPSNASLNASAGFDDCGSL